MNAIDKLTAKQTEVRNYINKCNGISNMSGDEFNVLIGMNKEVEDLMYQAFDFHTISGKNIRCNAVQCITV